MEGQSLATYQPTGCNKILEQGERMSNYSINLSTTEPNNYVGLIKFRQGDTNSQSIEATITENGQLFKFDRLSVFFNAALSNGNVVRDKVEHPDYLNSKINYIVKEGFLQDISTVTAWFSFEDGDKIIDSTKNFRYSVIGGWKEEIHQGNYIFELSEIQREIETIISNKDFTSFIERTNQNKTMIEYLENVKVDKEEMDEAFANQNQKIETIVSGTPREVFSNYAELVATYPLGEEGVFVTKDNGHWYYWSNKVWTDGGVYQGTALSNGSVDALKFSRQTDLKSVMEKLPNRYVSTSGINISFTDSPNFFVLKIPISNVGKLEIPLLETGGMYITATESDGSKVVFQKSFADFNQGADFSRWGYSFKSTSWVLDQQIVGNQFPEAFIYITQPNSNWDKFYVNTIAGLTLSSTLPYLDTSDVENKSLKTLSNQLQVVDMDVKYRSRMLSWDTTTKDIKYEANTQHAVFKLKNIPNKGRFRVPKTPLTSGQFIILTDKEDKAFLNLGWQYTQNQSNAYLYPVENNELELDLKKLSALFPQTFNIYIAMLRDDIFKFSPQYFGTTKVTDVFKWAEEEDENLKIVVPDYYPVLEGTPSYIYLDNVLQHGCAYDQTNIFASTMLGTQKAAYINETASSVSIQSGNIEVRVPIKRISKDSGIGGSKKVMIIGESTSESTVLLSAISERLTQDKVDFELVGSKTNGGFKNEARSGWGSGTLRYVQSAMDRTNAFINPETGVFDFKYYIDTTGVEIPDIVVINFGINEPNREVPEGKGADQVENYQFFIDDIRSVNPDTLFVIGLTHSSSRFGNFRRLDRREIILSRTAATLNAFKGKEYQGVFLAPYFLNIDPLWDMQYEEIPLNPYQSTLKDYIGTDQVHPSPSGYQKMADVMYWAIKSSL